MQRLNKQLIYGGTFLAIIIIILGWIYFSYLKPEPSCFDKRQNQNEEGIDCGGVCGNICFPANFRPIEKVGDPSFLIIDKKHISLIAKIQNPNDGFAARNFAYELKIMGDGEEPIKTISGESFIYAGEIKNIIIPNIEISVGDINSIELVISKPAWVKTESFPLPIFKLQNQTPTIVNGSLSIQGNIISQEATVFSEVEVFAIFKNSNRTPVGVSKTVINNFIPDETRAFSILHPILNSIDLNTTEILIYAKRA